MQNASKAIAWQREQVRLMLKAHLVLSDVARNIERGPKRKGKAAAVKSKRNEALLSLSNANKLNRMLPRACQIDTSAMLADIRAELDAEFPNGI